MDYRKTVDLIDANRNKINFGTYGYGVSDNWIEKAQQRLSMQFPPSFVWWLKNYGGGEINGDEIFSIYEIEFDKVIGGDIVYMNELFRAKGLADSNQLFIQTNDFGDEYYFDLNQKNDDGESPVYASQSDVKGIKYADDFLHFLEKKLAE